MSGISSGVGLISGINTASLIDQLIAIEARPVTQLQQRVRGIDAQRTSLLNISAQLLALKNVVSQFRKTAFFSKFSAQSSIENAVQIRTTESAVPGSYTFRVQTLVSNHSIISKGFADRDQTPVGVGTISIEVGNGRVARPTRLDALNGGAGVRRGVITIVDKSGESADIDLRTALTIDDIVEAVNTNTSANVVASVSGINNGASGFDRIIIEDQSGGTGQLIIRDKTGGFAATDLGIASTTSADRIEGHDLLRLTDATSLSALNDGNGVGRLFNGTDLTFETGGDSFSVSLAGILASDPDTPLAVLNNGNGVRLGVIRITDRTGASADIDLRAATTVREVLDAINNTEGVNTHVTIVNSRLLITDDSGGDENLTVEDIADESGQIGSAAADLGLAGSVEATSIQGHDLYRIETIGDVLRAINHAKGNNDRVFARISDNGNGIVLESLSGDPVNVVASTGSTAAQDLGLLDASFGGVPFESRHLVGGLNTVLLHSLNGGSGVGQGFARFTDRAGNTAEIDFGAAQTLQDVIDLINAAPSVSLVASINERGHGIALRDTSGSGGEVIIEDVSGTLATDLGLAGSFAASAGSTIDGGNAQVQYVSRQTKLSQLASGQPVSSGQIRITDSLGAVYSVNLSGVVTTVGGVIDAINQIAPDTIEARINDTGDGILVNDTSGGAQTLRIDDTEGRIASLLRIAGSANPGSTHIDGSLEIKINVNAGDTLNKLVSKINAAGVGISAAVVSDGGPVDPFSLTLTSTRSGTAGTLLVDTAGVDLSFSTLSAPRDALLTIGGEASPNPLLISSSSNSIDSVIDGVTLDLLSAPDEDVTVTVSQDVDAVIETIKEFVDKYNQVQQAISTATAVDPETFQRGPLLGDRTVEQIRSRLGRVAIQRFEGVDTTFSRLFNVGLRVSANNQLEFDEERFRQAYTESPDQVERLFTTEETGFGATIDATLEELTRDADGLIARRDELFTDQQELLNKRISELNVLLDGKRSRLQGQFVAMERALAALQGQQNSLSVLAQLASQ